MRYISDAVLDACLEKETTRRLRKFARATGYCRGEITIPNLPKGTASRALSDCTFCAYGAERGYVRDDVFHRTDDTKYYTNQARHRAGGDAKRQKARSQRTRRRRSRADGGTPVENAGLIRPDMFDPGSGATDPQPKEAKSAGCVLTPSRRFVIYENASR